MGGGQVLGNRGKVVKKALIGYQKIGAKVVVQTEGMLQTGVRHQERPALIDNKNPHIHVSNNIKRG